MIDFVIIGNCDETRMIRYSDISHIECDHLNPNDVSYWVFMKYLDSEGERVSFMLSKEEYKHILNKLMPEYASEYGYGLCRKCGGYPIPFSDPDEGIQGVECSEDPTHKVTCKYNARHCRAPLGEAWANMDFKDVSELCDC